MPGADLTDSRQFIRVISILVMLNDNIRNVAVTKHQK